MKKFFRSVKDWFVRHLPTKRRIIQVYVALLYNANLKGYIKGDIYKGKAKLACVPGMNCYSCPGAVGACPVGSLQNAFFQSGTRLPFYIFGIIGLYGLIFARTVCGFLCPVGLGQELLHKVPSPKIKKGRVTRLLSYLKYLVLVVLVIAIPFLYGLQGTAVPGFCKYICPAGTFGGGLGLLLNPLNQSGSRNKLTALNWVFTWKFALLCAILVLCVFLYRPFCRFLCPLGAIYGFFNKIAFLGVKVDKIKCTDCGLCVKHCEMDVKHVGDHECIHCGKCIKVCPVQAISWKGSGLFKKKTANEAQAAPALEAAAETVSAPINVQTAKVTVAPMAASEPVAQAAAPQAASEATTEPPAPQAAAKPKYKYSKAFWAEVIAWALAVVVLLSTLLYFNVFAETVDIENVELETECPDFTLRQYGENGEGRYTLLEDTFTLSAHRGTVVVINFWATWCGPCVAELPYFNQVATEYPEAKVVAIHGDSSEDVAGFITRRTSAKESWRGYNVLFLQDIVEGSLCKTFQALGGTGAWPMTLIVDKKGNVNFIQQGSISYEKLKTELEKALNKEYAEEEENAEE